MPVYFFGLPDDLALPEVSEELANDAEARHYRGVDHSYPGGSNVGGDVCSAQGMQAQHSSQICRAWTVNSARGTGSR